MDKLLEKSYTLTLSGIGFLGDVCMSALPVQFPHMSRLDQCMTLI